MINNVDFYLNYRVVNNVGIVYLFYVVYCENFGVLVLYY